MQSGTLANESRAPTVPGWGNVLPRRVREWEFRFSSFYQSRKEAQLLEPQKCGGVCVGSTGGLLGRWAPGQTNVLHFASIKSGVVIIRPFPMKQEAIFSANWLYFPCFERSAFRFCQSFLLPEQPAETCADSGNHQSQQRYSCSPFAPGPDSLVNFRTYSDICTLKYRLSSFAAAFAAIKWKYFTGYRAGPREIGS